MNKFLDEIPSIFNEEKEKVKKKSLALNTLTDSLKENIRPKSADDRTERNSKKKVSILFSVKTPKNIPLLPLKLKSFNKDFDIFTGHDLRQKSEILTSQKRQNPPKRRNEIDQENATSNT